MTTNNKSCNGTYPEIKSMVYNCPSCGKRINVPIVDGVLKQEKPHICETKENKK